MNATVMFVAMVILYTIITIYFTTLETLILRIDSFLPLHMNRFLLLTWLANVVRLETIACARFVLMQYN